MISPASNLLRSPTVLISFYPSNDKKAAYLNSRRNNLDSPPSWRCVCCDFQGLDYRIGWLSTIEDKKVLQKKYFKLSPIPESFAINTWFLTFQRRNCSIIFLYLGFDSFYFLVAHKLWSLTMKNLIPFEYLSSSCRCKNKWFHRKNSFKCTLHDTIPF